MSVRSFLSARFSLLQPPAARHLRPRIRPHVLLSTSLCAASAVAGCAPTLEVTGDRLYAAGKTSEAIASWEQAMQQQVMEYELSSLQEKRRKALLGLWADRTREVLAQRDEGDELKVLEALVALRAEALTSAGSVLAQFDLLIRAELDRDVLTKNLGDKPQHLGRLGALHQHMKEAACADEALGAVDSAIVTLLQDLVADRTPREPRWRALLELRLSAHESRFPEALTQAVEAQFIELSKQPASVASSDDEARALMLALLEADSQLWRAGASPNVHAALARELSQQADVLFARAQAAYQQGALATALELTELGLRGADGAHPGRQWTADLHAQTAALSLERAAKVQPEQRALALTHRSLAHHLGASNTGLEQAQVEVAPLYTFSPTLRLEAALPASCAELQAPLLAHLKQGGEVVELTPELTCFDKLEQESQSRSVTYNAQRLVSKEIEVEEQRSVTKESVRQEQCSRPGANGTWHGICEVRTPYQTTETVKVRKTIQVPETFSAQIVVPVSVVKRVVGAQGTIHARIQDGTTFSIPIQALINDDAEAFDYTLPPETLEGAPRRVTQQIPSSFTKQAARERSAATLAASLLTQLTQQVQAHRSALALARGQKAAAEERIELAAHEFALAALHVSSVDPSTNAFWSHHFGLSASLVQSALLSPQVRPEVLADAETRGARPPLAELAALPTGEIWVDTFQIKNESFGRIFYGHESGHFRARLLGIVQPNLPALRGGKGEGTHVAPGLSIAYSLGVLQGYVNGRDAWGLAMYDQLELGGALGTRVGPGGDDEGRLSFLLSAHYQAGIGYRARSVSFFAGARAGIAYAKTGDVKSAPRHLEPFARLALRIAGPSQIILEAAGLKLVPGLGQVDTLMLRIPAFGRDQFDFILSAERWQATTHVRENTGDGYRSLGTRTTYVLGAGMGIFW